MAEVKIIVEDEESFEEVEDTLVKAIESKEHDKLLNARFDDPLINAISDHTDSIFSEMYSSMMKEIIEIISE